MSIDSQIHLSKPQVKVKKMTGGGQRKLKLLKKTIEKSKPFPITPGRYSLAKREPLVINDSRFDSIINEIGVDFIPNSAQKSLKTTENGVTLNNRVSSYDCTELQGNPQSDYMSIKDGVINFQEINPPQKSAPQELMLKEEIQMLNIEVVEDSLPTPMSTTKPFSLAPLRNRSRKLVVKKHESRNLRITRTKSPARNGKNIQNLNNQTKSSSGILTRKQSSIEQTRRIYNNKGFMIRSISNNSAKKLVKISSVKRFNKGPHNYTPQKSLNTSSFKQNRNGKIMLPSGSRNTTKLTSKFCSVEGKSMASAKNGVMAGDKIASLKINPVIRTNRINYKNVS